MGMYIIAEPCIGTKDTACVDVCPVDCIHPRKDEEGLRDGRDALHRPGRLHPVRQLRAGLPGDGHLHGRDHPRQVEALPAGQRGLVQEKK